MKMQNVPMRNARIKPLYAGRDMNLQNILKKKPTGKQVSVCLLSFYCDDTFIVM